jgi:hypothetical protein
MRMREYKLAKKLFFIFSAKMYFAVYQFYIKFNRKQRFEKRFKMFLKLNCLLSVNVEFEINWYQILAWK